MTYSTIDYYGLADYHLVCKAHQALARRQRPEDFDTIRWYWKSPRNHRPQYEYQTELVGPFKIHSGPFWSLPVPVVCLYLDSQIKTYMDRDALGDAVRRGILSSEHRTEEALIAARERELARRIGGGSLEGTSLLMVAVECDGYLIGGMLVNPGTKSETVGTIMQSPAAQASAIAALQANFALPPADPFLAMKESELVDLVRYFRVPDQLVKRILPPHLLESPAYRKAVHLVRALTISGVFAVIAQWMERSCQKITTCVCETPNDDVKSLIVGKRIRAPDGTEMRIGAIPHRVVTSSTGTELYPAAYKNRPEGDSKMFTLYTFDFAEVYSRSKEYREQAIAAYQQGNSSAPLQKFA